MSSHFATVLLGEEPERAGQIKARLLLACGCVIEMAVASDRILSTVDGSRRAVGKYPCPREHPVCKP